MPQQLQERDLRFSASESRSFTIASYITDASPAPFTCSCDACGREHAIIGDIVRKGDVVVDVGANMGHYSMLFAELAGSSGRVFAFEPEPDNFALLTYNIALNNAETVTAAPLAMWGERADLALHKSATNYGRHSFRALNVPNLGEPVVVEAAPLDECVQKLGVNVDVLKIDVEGAELEVLRGAERVVREQARVVWFEYWPQGTSADLDTIRRTFGVFFDSGYSMEWIDLFSGERRRIETLEMACSETERLLRDSGDATSMAGLKLVEVLALRSGL